MPAINRGLWEVGGNENFKLPYFFAVMYPITKLPKLETGNCMTTSFDIFRFLIVFR